MITLKTPSRLSRVEAPINTAAISPVRMRYLDIGSSMGHGPLPRPGARSRLTYSTLMVFWKGILTCAPLDPSPTRWATHTKTVEVRETHCYHTDQTLRLLGTTQISFTAGTSGSGASSASSRNMSARPRTRLDRDYKVAPALYRTMDTDSRTERCRYSPVGWGIGSRLTC